MPVRVRRPDVRGALAEAVVLEVVPDARIGQLGPDPVAFQVLKLVDVEGRSGNGCTRLQDDRIASIVLPINGIRARLVLATNDYRKNAKLALLWRANHDNCLIDLPCLK